MRHMPECGFGEGAGWRAPILTRSALGRPRSVLLGLTLVLRRGREAAEGARDVRVNFRTVRPADYGTPYDTLLKNQVHFAAVDKGQNRLLNIMARPCGCWCMARKALTARSACVPRGVEERQQVYRSRQTIKVCMLRRAGQGLIALSRTVSPLWQVVLL